jgi:NosR/NirI family nitrous oxide reductase transcriptional regulator
LRFSLRRSGAVWLPVILLAALGSGVLFAQYQKAPPDFGGSYSFPTPTHPEPRESLVLGLDVVMLAAGLGIGAWLILKRRKRSEVMMLSIGAIAYFGFYRKGCICPIGAIQNVTLSLVDPSYMISYGVIAFFFLPLVAALLFGRVFCGGVCPLGAIQDIVLLRPLKVPEKLDRILGWLPYIYLGVAVWFAGWGLNMTIGSWKLEVGKRFLICEWDPFIGLYRITGPFHMLALGVGFILVGMFFGRPYCRWLCP